MNRVLCISVVSSLALFSSVVHADRTGDLIGAAVFGAVIGAAANQPRVATAPPARVYSQPAPSTCYYPDQGYYAPCPSQTVYVAPPPPPPVVVYPAPSYRYAPPAVQFEYYGGRGWDDGYRGHHHRHRHHD